MSTEILLDTTDRRFTDKSVTNDKSMQIRFVEAVSESITENAETPTEGQESVSNKSEDSLSKSLNRKIVYHIKQESNEIVIQVLDGETGEVIREIPQQDFVRLVDRSSNINKYLLDETV